jgi:hypothetical protein
MNNRQPPTATADLAPTRAMADFLSPDGIAELARAIHAVLNAPPTAASRRIAELRFLTSLLEERPQAPEFAPYVERTVYDERRKKEAPDAPPSARLTERYGSWPRACRAAWGLLADGRSFGPADPWSRPPRRRANWTREEGIASVLMCRDAFGRWPSSYEYHHWVINRRAREKKAGIPTRTVPLSTVYRLLAPDKSNRNGWTLVLERVEKSLA